MCLRIGKLHIKCLASRAAKQSDRPYTAMIASGSQRGKRARQHNNGLCSGVRGAPEEIRTPDPQIRSLVLYPAELRARRVVAIAFDRRWQGDPISYRRRLKGLVSAVAVGVIVTSADGWSGIGPVFGFDPQALAKCKDEKSDDCAEQADDSRR